MCSITYRFARPVRYASCCKLQQRIIKKKRLYDMGKHHPDFYQLAQYKHLYLHIPPGHIYTYTCAFPNTNAHIHANTYLQYVTRHLHSCTNTSHSIGDREVWLSKKYMLSLSLSLHTHTHREGGDYSPLRAFFVKIPSMRWDPARQIGESEGRVQKSRR